MATDGRGGKRANSGRKSGSKTQLYTILEGVKRDNQNFNICSWLVSVVRNEDHPISARIQAASSAMKYMYFPPQPSQEQSPEPIEITSFEIICYSETELAELENKNRERAN